MDAEEPVALNTEAAEAGELVRRGVDPEPPEDSTLTLNVVNAGAVVDDVCAESVEVEGAEDVGFAVDIAGGYVVVGWGGEGGELGRHAGRELCQERGE